MTNISQKLEAYISFSVGKSQDNIRYKTSFKNLIVDNGLNNAATLTIDSLTTRCRLGSSTGNITTGDTDLGNRVGSFATATSPIYGHSSGNPAWYTYARYNYVFAAGSVVGDLAEIGFFDTSDSMFSHARLKDGVGEPTVVTVLSDEAIYVTYEVRKYPQETDQTGTFVLAVNGIDTTFNFTARPALINTGTSTNYWYGSHQLGSDTNIVAYESKTLGTVTGTPTGTAVAGVGTLDTYIAGSFKSTLNCVFDPPVANFATGIGSMMLSNGFQISFNPVLPKTSDRRLVLPLSILYARKE